MHSWNWASLTMDLMKTGQFGSVKFCPMLESKGVGRGCSDVDATSISSVGDEVLVAFATVVAVNAEAVRVRCDVSVDFAAGGGASSSSASRLATEGCSGCEDWNTYFGESSISPKFGSIASIASRSTCRIDSSFRTESTS